MHLLLDRLLDKYEISNFEDALSLIRTTPLDPSYDKAWTLAAGMLTRSLRDDLMEQDPEETMVALLANGLIIGLIVAELKKGSIITDVLPFKGKE